jgi:hypothetical protein
MASQARAVARQLAGSSGASNLLLLIIGLAVFAFGTYLSFSTYFTIHDVQYGTFAILQKLVPYAPENMTRLVAEKLSSLTGVFYSYAVGTLLAFVGGLMVGMGLRRQRVVIVPAGQAQVSAQAFSRQLQIAPLPHVEELELIRSAVPSGVIERLYPALARRVQQGETG